jgi:hypothetical protein
MLENGYLEDQEGDGRIPLSCISDYMTQERNVTSSMLLVSLPYAYKVLMERHLGK